jgi:hypothetical protein
MKQNLNEDGYYSITLKTPTKKQRHLIHRLVAQAFLDNFDKEKCINHKDSNRSNNHIDNLECITLQENSIHSYTTGNNVKFKKGVHMIDLETAEILKSYNSIAEASEETGVNRMSITHCCMKRSKFGGNYYWQYQSESTDNIIIPKINNEKLNIHQLDIQTGEVINIFKSMKLAVEFIQGDRNQIYNVCSGRKKEYKGF